MYNFVHTNYDVRTSLIFSYQLKKNASQAHQMFVEAYGGHVLSRTQCFRCYEKFQSVDLDVRNEERRQPPKKFQDAKLQALLNDNDSQMQKQLTKQLGVDRQTVKKRLKPKAPKI
uniref:Putative LOC101234914 [Hydra vulgaris] n=1 Tax=Lepeophtheirus salmonis TaxID=72036 RepID=A0A0K2ULN0_LEPSM